MNVQWEKSPEALVQTFASALPEDPRLERRKMFGYPAAFVGGNMFASVHGTKVILRLSEEQRRELLAMPGAAVFEPMQGRQMREYVVVPEAIVGDTPRLRAWTEKAFEYAASLAPKEKKPRRSG